MIILSIDFDGTIVYDTYPSIGEEIPFAVHSINDLHANGFCIIISSCRTGKYQEEMISWLREHNVHFCRVNENCPCLIEKYGTDTRKISADLYIDFEKDLLSLHFPSCLSWLGIKHNIARHFGDLKSRGCKYENP